MIFLVSHHLKMILVDTQAVVAHVVDLFLARNEAVLVSECDYVNSHSLSVKRHSGVSTPSAFSGMGTSPDVTRTGHAIDLESHVDNRDVGGDLPPDVSPSAHGSELSQDHTLALEYTGRLAASVDLGHGVEVPRIGEQ